MDPQRVLAGLVVVAERLGIEVKSTALRGTHPSAGGLCRINGKSVVFLNSKASPLDRGFALAQVLSGLDLGGLEIREDLLRYIAHPRQGAPKTPRDNQDKSAPAARRLGPGVVSAKPSRRSRRFAP